MTSTTEYPSQQCVAKPADEEAVVTPSVISEVAEEAPIEVKELVIEKPKTPKSKGYQNKAIRKPQTKVKFVPAEPNGHVIHVGEEITVPGDDIGNSVVVSVDV